MTKRYRALVPIHTPKNEKEYLRIQKSIDDGQPLTAEEREMVEVQEGHLIRYIPEVSIDWMLRQGLIEEVEE